MMTTVMIIAVVAIMIAQAVHVNNKIEKEYAECKKYADIFDKIGISEEDMKKIENR